MQIHWGKFPRARNLSCSGVSLSQTALKRLAWMEFCHTHGRNAALTCRRFAISRQTFYRWKRRFDRHDLVSLEAHSPCSTQMAVFAPVRFA